MLYPTLIEAEAEAKLTPPDAIGYKRKTDEDSSNGPSAAAITQPWFKDVVPDVCNTTVY